MAESDDLPPRLTLLEEREQLSDFLLAGQRFLLDHPQAARELIIGFIEEGRRFAQTPEGQSWMVSLKDTELAKRALLIWEAFGLDLLLENRSAIPPSNWLDMIFASISNPDLESILQMLLLEEIRDGEVGLT